MTVSELVVNFGLAVCEERLRQGLSQRELSARCGTHWNYIGAIERGATRPTLPVMARLAQGLGVPLAELVATAEQGYEPYVGPQRQVGTSAAVRLVRRSASKRVG